MADTAAAVRRVRREDIFDAFTCLCLVQVLCMQSADRLLRLQLLVWVDKKSAGGGKEHRALRLGLCPQHLLEIFERGVDLPSVVRCQTVLRDHTRGALLVLPEAACEQLS